MRSGREAACLIFCAAGRVQTPIPLTKVQTPNNRGATRRSQLWGCCTRCARFHAQFQAKARAQLLTRYPDPAHSLRPWAEDLRLIWHADLDFVDGAGLLGGNSDASETIRQKAWTDLVDQLPDGTWRMRHDAASPIPAVKGRISASRPSVTAFNRSERGYFKVGRFLATAVQMALHAEDGAYRIGRLSGPHHARAS